MNKFLILILGIFLVGSVFAGSIVNVTPEHFEIPNLYAGDSFETSFSFEYPEEVDNYNNAPLIVKVDIVSNSVGYPVWKGDFEMNMEMKQYFLGIPYRTIPLTCTEKSPLEFNYIGGIDLRYIEEIPNGTFYCYNENLYILNLNSRNDVTLEVQTNIALYPDLYNFTIEFYEIDEYAIVLREGWNLISFPFVLADNSVEYLFNESEEVIEVIWSYEDGEWKVYSPYGPSNLGEINPGRGYWIKSNKDTFILVGTGDLLNPLTIPPIINLDEGWNLIGHYGLDSKQAYCNLFSLIDTQQGSPKWSALYKFDSLIQDYVQLNKIEGVMNPGEGYWIEMDVPDSYNPATTCPNPPA